MTKSSYRRNRRNRRNPGVVEVISTNVGSLGKNVGKSVGNVGKTVIVSVKKTPGYFNKGFTQFKKLFGMNSTPRRSSRRTRRH